MVQKEEEGLNTRFQKHFKNKGFNGKFEKFNKITEDLSKSKTFLKRFWFKRTLLIIFNVFSKFEKVLLPPVRRRLRLNFGHRSIISILLPSSIQYWAFQLSITRRTLLYQRQKFNCYLCRSLLQCLSISVRTDSGTISGFREMIKRYVFCIEQWWWNQCLFSKYVSLLVLQ